MKISLYASVFVLLIATLPGGSAAQSQEPVSRQGICRKLAADTIDVLHYDIHLNNVNLTAKQIKGYTTLKFTPRINDLDHLTLQLLSMNIDSIFIGKKKIETFSYAGGVLKIPFLTQAGIGDTLDATVYYHGQPYVDPSNWGGFHFSGQYAFNLGIGFESDPHNMGRAWFPCIDDFHDRATYDVYGRAGNDKKAISGGTLVSVMDNGDKTNTWHWNLDKSIPAYLASFAVGDYTLVADTFQGMNARVPITYYVLPAEAPKVPGTFLHMKEIMATYESHFGPYPFARVGITATAIGAMEHATNIAFPYSGITGDLSGEGWYAHELSHMWFGDMVTCASAEDMWMNEGWAVWCESLFREGIYNYDAYRDNMRSKLRDVLQNTHITDEGYRALYGIPTKYTYGSTVYAKGGIVVHTLRNYLGDSLFFGGVKAYLRKYAYNYASTYDLRDFLSAYSGINLNDFFDAWIFRPGFPQFSIDSVKVVPGKGSYNARVFVRQKLKGVAVYAKSNRLEITFMGPKWQFYTDTLSFSGNVGSKTFSVPFFPSETMVDLHEKIADATTDLAKVIKSTGEIDFPEIFAKIITERVPDSAYVRITHNWVTPDSLKAPIAGLRLSDYRYWKVEGLFPSGFKAKGCFFYDRDNFLDNTLLIHPDDSIVMLYRPGAADDWRPTAFVKYGNFNAGYLTIDSLQRGEYTLAVFDKTLVGQVESPKSKPVIKTAPNPVTGSFNK
jgi:Aminopeptidase N